MSALLGEAEETAKKNINKTVQGALVEALVMDADTLKDQTLQAHDRQHHPNGYHEGDTCKFRDKIMEDTPEDSADEIESGRAKDFSQEELSAMEKEFGFTDNIAAGGWVLPDGRLLDFNRDYHKDGHKEWDEHGDISKAFSEARKEKIGLTKGANRIDGLMAGIGEALKAGGIRYGNGPDGLYMDIGKEPTKAQYEFLEKMACYDWQQDPFADGEGHIITMKDGDKVLSYPDNEVLRKRLVPDVKKYFAGDNQEESQDAAVVRMFHGERFSNAKPEGNQQVDKQAKERLIDKKYVDGQKMYDFEEKMAKFHPNISPQEVLSRLSRLGSREEMEKGISNVLRSKDVE